MANRPSRVVISIPKAWPSGIPYRGRFPQGPLPIAGDAVSGSSGSGTLSVGGTPGIVTDVSLINQGGPNVSSDIQPGNTNTSYIACQWAPVSGAVTYSAYRSDNPNVALQTGITPTQFTGYISNGTPGQAGTILTVLSVIHGTVIPLIRPQCSDNTMLPETMINGKQISGTVGAAGTYPVNRSQALGTAVAPVTFSACVMIDLTATNAVVPTFDGQGTSYSYKFTAVNAQGEGPKSTRMVFWIYRRGFSNTGNADLSFGTITENYASVAGNPQSGPFCAQVIANHGGFQPSMDNPASPKWVAELGWARFMLVSFNPGSSYSGWKLNMGVVRRTVPEGDIFGTAAQTNAFDYPVVPGTVPQANTWADWKNPLNPQILGWGKFQLTGALAGSTLTVSAVGADANGVAGRLDNGAFIFGPGLPAGAHIHASLSGTTFTVWDKVGPVSLNISSGAMGWTWQGTNLYKFLAAVEDPAQPITSYYNDLGFADA